MDAFCIGAQASDSRSKVAPIAIEVRQAKSSDRDAIAAFVEEAYGARARYKGTPRWTWQFVDNPFGSHPEGTVPVWIALDGDRVVGQIAVQDAVLQVQDTTLEAGWIVDVMILPSHRGSGLGHRLYDAVARDVAVLVTLTMALATRRMAERLGAVTVGDVHQLTRWVRLDRDSVREYLMTRTANYRWARTSARVGCDVLQFHRVFPWLANPLLAIRDRARARRRVPGPTTITEVETFGAEVDDLWENTHRGYSVIFSRDARFLNWRFVECPQPSYRRFLAERDGRTVGYVILRQAEPVELPNGTIVDLYAAREDNRTIEDLLLHSLAFFGDGVAAIDCATSIPEFERIFRRHGFFRTRTMHPTCVCQDPVQRGRLIDLKDDWFFTKADHDWDQIHVADSVPAGSD